MDEWDPIGVSGIERARDEYDHYASTITSEPSQFQSAEDICRFLIDATEEKMGVRSDSERCRKAALAVWDCLSGR